MVLNITFLFLLIALYPTMAMSNKPVADLPDKLLDEALDKAFAPLLARQEEVEHNALARLKTSITADDIPDHLIENAVQGALAPLLAIQEAMENNTFTRLDSLQALVSSLASVVRKVFQVNNTTDPPHHPGEPQTPPSSSSPSHALEYPPNDFQDSPRTTDWLASTPSPQTPSLRSSSNNSYSYSPRLSLCKSSSPTSTPTRSQEGSLSSASRTLGFFPVTFSQGDHNLDNPNPTTIHAALEGYLRDVLCISDNDLPRLEAKHVWYSSKKNMVFAEFFSINMCYTIFKHYDNLKELQRVEQYIHPSLKPTFSALSHHANHLRHDLGYYSTRIDYKADGLVLLLKTDSRSPWAEHDPQVHGEYEPPPMSPNIP